MFVFKTLPYFKRTSISLALQEEHPWIRVDLYLGPVLWILHQVFPYILDVNFTFVFLLVSVLGCSLWRYIRFLKEFFLLKGNYIFKLSIYVGILSNFTSFPE
jgi:hypothetical protein